MLLLLLLLQIEVIMLIVIGKHLLKNTTNDYW